MGVRGVSIDAVRLLALKLRATRSPGWGSDGCHRLAYKYGITDIVLRALKNAKRV